MRDTVICFLACSLLFVGGTWANDAKTSDNKAHSKAQVKPLLNKPVSAKRKVRFYKANKQLQATGILLTDEKSSSAGCQNFLKKVTVFKVVQIGFSNCTVFAEKGCPVNSSIAAINEDQAFATTLLTEGVGWFPQGDTDRGATVKSWRCDSDIEDGQVAHETRTARREMMRLKREAAVLARKAAEAQEKANRAQKVADDAKEYARQVKEYALATGAIEPEPEEEESAEGKKAGKTKKVRQKESGEGTE
jgi:hypothetical protein